MKQENFYKFVKDMIDLHNNYKEEASYSVIIDPKNRIHSFT